MRDRFRIVGLGALMGLAGCGIPQSVYEEEMGKERAKNEALRAEMSKTADENRLLTDVLKASEIDKKKYQQLLTAQERYNKQLEETMKSLKGSVGSEEGFEFEKDRIRLTDVLFDSGSDTLKPRAQEKLKTIAAKLMQEGRAVRVEGHTDGQPIVKTKDKFADNWDLASKRALTVLRFLSQAGIPGEHLEASAFGEFRPLSGQKNAPNRGTPKNRRVEIVFVK